MRAAVLSLAVSFICLIVNRNSLECQTDSEDDPSEDANSDNDDAVCATNGVTYPSLCRLLQDTGNEAVAYAGECDREECQGGSVSSYMYMTLFCLWFAGMENLKRNEQLKL